MFTPEDRGALRQLIVDRARSDRLVVGCALLGSAARDEEDAWSDIDVALQLAADVDLENAAASWTSWLEGVVRVADRLDVHANGALYRVFLTKSSLQVDLSFWPDGTFRAVGAPVRLLFGEAGTPGPAPDPAPTELVCRGWLVALHARSAVARGRTWQAEMMLADLRDQIVALACHRHNVDPGHGRGAHALPTALLHRLGSTRATAVEHSELLRSFLATVDLFRAEVARQEHVSCHGRIDEALAALARSVGVGEPTHPRMDASDGTESASER